MCLVFWHSGQGVSDMSLFLQSARCAVHQVIDEVFAVYIHCIQLLSGGLRRVLRRIALGELFYGANYSIAGSERGLHRVGTMDFEGGFCFFVIFMNDE